MPGKIKIQAATMAALLLLAASFGLAGASSRLQLPEPEEINADEKAVGDIVEFYEEIEDTLDRKDLEGLMAFYSDDYGDGFITKSQLREVWSGIFERFEHLYSVHILTKIHVWETEAALTCTGVIMGLPHGGDDYEIVDQWVTRNHYLSMKDGSWRIVGGASQWGLIKEGKIPGEKETYRIEFHPLF